ncbi:HTH_Tnp_Tc3_2 domain-containing protein [Trichonephila clavipes]|nr:HTH_Tnp_Tc3_2 domain-containing protein [Trichonephila clavipes]
MDITPKKRIRIVTFSQHTSMTVRNFAAVVGFGKFSVSRIINQLKNFGTVSPKRRKLFATGVSVDSSTARRRLIEASRFARKPNEKQLIMPAIKKKRLDCARKYQSWIEQDWKKSVFSDETQFLVQRFRLKFVSRSV